MIGMIQCCVCMYRLVQMTRSGWVVLLARSRASTNARFSAALISITFLLTGEGLSGGGEGRDTMERKRKRGGQEEAESERGRGVGGTNGEKLKFNRYE